MLLQAHGTGTEAAATLDLREVADDTDHPGPSFTFADADAAAADEDNDNGDDLADVACAPESAG